MSFDIRDGVLVKYTGDQTEVVIPDGVTSIGDMAFKGCRCLAKAIIPNSVTSIGDMAFSGCTGLTRIEIPDSVTSIGEYAFSFCRGLTSIEIPNDVTSISNGAFYYCTGLIRVIIPNSVTSIGDKAFESCIGLRSIEIPDGVESIGSWAFNGCTSLTNIEIPYGVESISKGTFYECTNLTEVSIPSSVTSIGLVAFGKCTSLIGIVIPNGVTSIGRDTFMECTSLTEVDIPEGCVLGYNVFKGCNALETIVILESDIERLREKELILFPKPFDQYNIIIKQSGKAVWQLTDKNKAEYSGEAIETYRHVRGAGLTPVMVRFLIPVCYYSLSQAYRKLPFIIRQEIYHALLVFKFNEIQLPSVCQELICKHLISLHGINVCKALDYKFQSESDDLEKTKISNNDISLALR